MRGVIHSSLLIALAGLAITVQPVGAQSDSARVQPPTFRQPERGSLTGSLAKFSIGAEDASRGSFSLPLPVEVPSERGALLVGVLPSYSPESGISEWGIGWSASLSIQRFRLKGDVDYQTDDFTSPWGRLQQGSDGAYYPAGLRAAVRLELTTQGWVAVEPSGTRYEFAHLVNKPGGTYGWYLTRTTTVLGDATTTEYVSGTDGRPFVSKVFYGGPEEPTTYRLNVEHELLDSPLVDYRSGHPISLDRRVVGVVVWAKERGRGTYRRRWRYDLAYRDDHFGPGFRIESVMRTFASGDVEPPVTYEYDLPEQAAPTGIVFGTGALEEVPNVAEMLDDTFDRGAIRPSHATTTDLDDDGLPDLEHGFTFAAYRQGADGTFTAESLGPRPPGSDFLCRPNDAFIARARTLVRMAGPGSDLQVLRLQPQFGTTNIRVCDREGAPRLDVSVPGHWTLGENIKLADLNRDDRPDLLQVDTGKVVVLENISGEGIELGFRAHAPIPLTYVFGFPFTPSASWAQDINGDGNPDLIQRTDDSMSVWYGSGRFGFDVMEHPMVVLNRAREEILTLDDWEVTWVDANKDGLTDMLMAYGSESSLFINEGDHFAEAEVPTLDHANTFHMGVPVIGDYRGRGDLDLYFLADGVDAAALSTPSTGLLISADDGKGSVVAFEYERSAPVPGLRQRPAVLRSMTASSGGHDDLTVQYGYAAPRTHTVGHFLVGFGSVEVSGPVTSTSADFYNDDEVTAQLETSKVLDSRTPGLMQLSRTTYEEAIHQGVRVRRPRTTTSGWCTGTNVSACITGTTAALETWETLAYQRGICPTQVRAVSRHGTLERTTTLASPAALVGALHCAQGSQVTTGTHPDSSLNFRLEDQVTLNDLGQPTQVRRIGGAEVLVLQNITYDPVTHRIATISSPGQGTQTFTFDPGIGQLGRVDGADGTIASVQGRDARMDAPLALAADHGPGGVLVSSFRYDGMERLADRWADFGGSSASAPLESLGYQFPTLEFPGLVEVSSLVDSGAQTRIQEAVWTYPDGTPFTAARRAPNGWVVGTVDKPSRADLRDTKHRRSPLRIGDEVALQTYATLLAGGIPLAEATKAGFGHEVTTRQTVQQGVERTTTGSLTLDKRLLVSTQRENDLFETRTAADAVGRLVWVRDQNNFTTNLKRDAAGRLVGVTLPDGTTQTLTFDAFGRPSRVRRSGIGDVVYAYAATTGLLHSKTYRDADDEVERTVTLHYDVIGRVRERVHVLGTAGTQARFRFRYDGDVGTGTPVPGQKGYLTRIEGPAYESTSIRNPDGTEASSTFELAGWMRIGTTTSYYAGGQVNEEHRTITRVADGAVVDDVTTRHLYDAWGRLDHLETNGTTLAELHYDDNNQISWVGLPNGQRIDHVYDPATLRQTGYSQQIADQAGVRQTGQDWTFNNRGLIANEALDLGDQSWLRIFRYDLRGFLTRSEDADQLATYSYTSAGLPKQVTDEEGTRTVHRGQARQLTVDGLAYAWDASGRVIQRGQTTFDYGPDGHLAVAHAVNRTLVYHYDADGNRLLKYQDGLPVAGYLDGGYLTDTGLLAPVKIGGRVVGVLDHGELQLLATDSRGTVLADRDGTPRLASPYGVRATRPDLAVALDYVEKAYDPDLASIRMGVRDYDPLLGQFWTPDPLYAESIEKCAESIVDCNLYSYGRNDPLRHIDPTGTDPNERDNRGVNPHAPLEVQHLQRSMNVGRHISRSVVQSVQVGIKATKVGASVAYELSPAADVVNLATAVFEGRVKDGLASGGLILLGALTGGSGKIALKGLKRAEKVLGLEGTLAGRAATRLPDEAFVVRGGVATPEQIAKGIGPHREVPDLTGFSAQSKPGASVEQLAATGGVGGGPFPHRQISVTTVGELRCIGCDVVPSPGGGANHVTVTPGPATPATISEQFVQRPNPARRR